MKSNRVTSLAVLKCLLLMVFPTAAAKADLIETLAFTGTATCGPPYTVCSSFPTGPLNGTYSLDVDAQAIVGSWSFSTPFASFSSADTGATAGLVDRFGDINPYFAVTTTAPLFLEFVQFYFPLSDPQEIGPLASNDPSDACVNLQGGFNGARACYPAYVVTGSTSLVSSFTTPEPSSIVLLATVALGLLVLNLRRSASRL